MDKIFQSELLYKRDEISNEILNSDYFNKHVCDINSNKKKKYSEIEIKNIIYCLDYSYHYLGKALVSDEEFEKLEESTRKLYPDLVLYSTKYMSQSILPYPMPSLTKLYNKEFDKIQKNISIFSSIVISSKLDGISCLLISKNNKISLYTKGNGIKGRNISHILNYINLDTNKIPNRCVLRGELIIKKVNTKVFNTTGSLRSQIIGLINRDIKNIDEETRNLFKTVDLVFYHVIKPKSLSFFKQFLYITELDLARPKFLFKYSDAISKSVLEHIYEDFLANEEYEIDGLVIADAETQYDLQKPDTLYNNYIFAFKQNKHFAITTIEKIEWQTSKNCFLIPVLYCKPVVLLNSKITKMSGFNAKNVINKRIGIGSKVSITLGGNIIPVVDTVIEPSDDIPIPENVTWNGVNIVSNVVNFTNVSKIIEKYFSAFSIKGMSHKTIFNILVKLETKQIVVKNIFDFFKGIEYWKSNYTEKILGEKTDIALMSNLKKMKETPISINTLLVATNYFVLISDVKMKTIFELEPILYDYIIDFKNTEEERNLIYETALSIPTIANKMALNFLKGIEEFYKNKKLFEETFNIVYKPKQELERKNKIPRIVFTSIKNVESYLQMYEGNFILSLTLTKGVDYLVVPNCEFKITSKYKKAERYGIEIITLSKFREMMNEIKNQMII